MKILLINPPLTGVQSETRLPLGLSYIASVLRNDGHDVRVIDVNALKLSYTLLEELIKDNEFDAVGLTGLITQFRQIQRITSIVRKTSGVKIVLGGGLASAAPEVVLMKTYVDIAVIGEGEGTVVELFQALAGKRPLEDVDGISYRKDNEIFSTGQRKPIEDISSLPFPAWDLFPMERYFNKNAMCMPERRISLVTSRGCPYRCTFCFHGIFGHRYRSRTAENIFLEMEFLYKKYRVRGFVFEDDTFVLNRKRVYRLCELIIKKKLKVYWTCNARINLVDKELIDRMKKAGCVEISYGIESGNQAQLDRIKKDITIKDAYRVIDMTKKAGIMTHGFMMIGIPGDTVDTVRDSIKFCKRAGLQAEFTILAPIPGSKLFQDAVNMRSVNATAENFVENWGSWLDEVLVNFTNLSDEKLIELKRNAENEIFTSYYKRNTVYIIRMLFLEFRVNGLFAVLTRLKRGLKALVRARKGPDLRERPDSV
ncbi:MAG TPA: radical SAM protein [Nitrospirae bacterium]|nr:radical SAM superfamily protein [bacterium BMS3Abin10]GBE39557.1 radical SAM superfamily protein [bacterium BMS3Bbin08]HDH51126.1 radical SAM protein [Nitrospirota bacterium]HDK16468.1 radical SAM protein [Nitrospirota bacterium]HDK41336.1 radical SAM protein [Nitrospirota bacterium]